MSGPDGGNDDPLHSSDHPNEPDLPGEDNPGERLIEQYDPTIDAESTPEPSAEPDFGDVDVDDETARLFWYLVFVFNVSLLALAVGPMFVVFLDRWVLGGQITAAGAILSAYGYYRYRKHARSGDGGGDETGDDGENETGDASENDTEAQTEHEPGDEAESGPGHDDGNG